MSKLKSALRRGLAAALVLGATFPGCLLGQTNSGDAAVLQLVAEVAGKGWIIYGGHLPDGSWDLFRCRPDGSQVENLSKTPEWNEFAPQLSRDGKKLLYRRLIKDEKFESNRYGEQGQLIIANADGSDPKVFGQTGAFPWASWSPDGNQIACLSIKGITIVDVATKHVKRTLERKGFFQQLTWSPDGNWFVGVANSYGTGWSIARMDVQTGEPSAVNKVDCCTPDWFPTPDKVIFSWRPPGQKENNGSGWTQLWMADAKGESRQLIYGEDGRHVYGGHVSPDGKYVLFNGNVREDGDLENAGSPMGLMRLSDAPIVGGESRELRSKHGKVNNGPVLKLPAGWEPCWTYVESGSTKSP